MTLLSGIIIAIAVLFFGVAPPGGGSFRPSGLEAVSCGTDSVFITLTGDIT